MLFMNFGKKKHMSRPRERERVLLFEREMSTVRLKGVALQSEKTDRNRRRKSNTNRSTFRV